LVKRQRGEAHQRFSGPGKGRESHPKENPDFLARKKKAGCLFFRKRIPLVQKTIILREEAGSAHCMEKFDRSKKATIFFIKPASLRPDSRENGHSPQEKEKGVPPSFRDTLSKFIPR